MADRIKKHMSESRVRILPREVEKNVKDFAQNVENLVDKVVSGECAEPAGRAVHIWGVRPCACVCGERFLSSAIAVPACQAAVKSEA